MPPVGAASIAGAHEYGRNVGRHYRLSGTRVLEAGPSASGFFLLPSLLPIMFAAHYQHVKVETAALSTTALAFAPLQTAGNGF